MRQLTKIARETGRIMEPHLQGGGVKNKNRMDDSLSAYSEIIEPWAEMITGRNLRQLEDRTLAQWQKHSKKLHDYLQAYLKHSPIGELAKNLQARQVQYIKSIPIEAGLRIHEIDLRLRTQELAMESAISGRRAEELQELLTSDDNIKVTVGRAKTLARTEIARANAQLVTAQCYAVGIDNYIWRNMQDSVVRHTHQDMEGKVCSFSQPPEVEPGKRYNPGEIYNCRCWAEPIIPELADEYTELANYPDLQASLQEGWRFTFPGL